ncbi:hypothetical protein [Pedobacter gandavensis]|uniref:hypothetical protein n=1 Tax=Pedobacter gandavensis TaxID=2679963 RepID=UPI00292E9C03|nr:hypothetical protein [Pedobacter gandavensis]
MLFKVKFSVLIFFFGFALILCNPNDRNNLVSHSKKKVVYNKVKLEKYDIPFDSLLEKINIKINGSWDPPVRMDGNKDFMVLYNAPDKYYDDFLRVMKNKNYQESKKMICVFAAQKLNFEKYLDFANYCLAMFEKDNLSEDILFFVLFPNGWNTRLRFAEKYDDPRVHELFKKVLNKKDISDRSKISLNHIYTGATWTSGPK